MKSYLRFLSRNKLYTAIEVVGLSIALAFTIFLGSYIVQDLSCDSKIENADEIHVVRNKKIMNEFLVRHDMCMEQLGQVPGIKDVCQYSYMTDNPARQLFRAEYKDEEYILNSLVTADRNFFDFFTLPLAIGNPENIMVNPNGAVISEHLSKTIFGDRNPVGETISVQFAFNDDRTKAEFMVEGVFAHFPTVTVREPDIVIRMDHYYDTYASIFSRQNREDPRLQFVRVDQESNTDNIISGLNCAFNGVASRDDFYDTDMVSLKDFYRKEAHNEQRGGQYCNCRNTDTFNIYMIICLLLCALSLLNYILLTVAYSHFRIKEMATRQVLGTDKVTIMTRCILESMFLIAVSMILAGIIAISCRNIFSALLDIDLIPLNTITEYLILAVAALIMALPAGMSSSIALTRYNPIHIIKGKKRMVEKSLLSKVFIGFEGFLAITSTITLIGVTMQIIFMMNYPMGYVTDDLICIDFRSTMPRHTDELRALPFVEDLGMIDNTPMRFHVTFPKGGNAIGHVEAQRHTFDMMGISISDYGEPDESPSGVNHYLSNETMDAIPGAIENREWLIDDWGRRNKISGTCSHFRLGTMKMTDFTLCAAYVFPDWSAERIPESHNVLVKVNVDEDRACREIESMYESLGYDLRNISVKSFNQLLEEDLKEERNLQSLLLAFVLTCLLLTGMAITAFSSYYAQLQTHDAAIRKVFGVPRKELFWKTAWGFMIPVLLSAVVSIPAAYIFISKWLEKYAFRIDNSWMIYAGGLAVVLFVAFASVCFQAVGLMRTNPAEALKKE